MTEEEKQLEASKFGRLYPRHKVEEQISKIICWCCPPRTLPTPATAAANAASPVLSVAAGRSLGKRKIRKSCVRSSNVS